MPKRHHRMRIAALLSALALFAACASPSARFDRKAASERLQKTIVPGVGFEHALYRRDVTIDASQPLHVYLGSDGSPWINNQPSSDATPYNPITLRLMTLDAGQSIYVGRPCYHGLSASPGCKSDYWTSERYSSAVVDSIVQVINNYAGTLRLQEIVLIGYSGGGTIAALAADKIDGLSTLITIAANLDTESWSQHHDYDPLTGSLNPARQSPLADTVRQIHLDGGNDRTVPASTSEQYFEVNAAASRTSYQDFDHQCCWEDIWSEFLSTLR